VHSLAQRQEAQILSSWSDQVCALVKKEVVIKWEPQNLLLYPQKPAVGLSRLPVLSIPFIHFHVWVSQVIDSLAILQLKVLMPMFVVIGTKYWNTGPLAHLRFKFKGML